MLPSFTPGLLSHVHPYDIKNLSSVAECIEWVAETARSEESDYPKGTSVDVKCKGNVNGKGADC